MEAMQGIVAPFVGAWIETNAQSTAGRMYNVAPFVGAWIETTIPAVQNAAIKSLPSWERGLKHFYVLRARRDQRRRSLRGSVD